MIKREIKTLCDRCRWVSYLRYGSQMEPMRICNSLNRRVPDVVVECSLNLAPDSMTLSEMQISAWYIDPLPQGKIGFLRPGTVEHREASGFGLPPTPLRGPR